MVMMSIMPVICFHEKVKRMTDISGVAKEWRGRVFTYTEETDWTLLLTCTFMAFNEDDARINCLFYCFNECERRGFGPKMINLVVEEIKDERQHRKEISDEEDSSNEGHG